MSQNSNELSRRSFLKKSVSALASGAMAAPLSVASGAPGIVTLQWMQAGLFETSKEELEQKLKKDKQHVYLRSKNENFLNVGVKHDSDLLELHLEKTFLGQALRESDIVLLENPKGDYFAKLKKHADDLGKKVINIDRAEGTIVLTLQLYATLWSSFRSLKQLGIDWVGAGLSEDEKTAIRKEWVGYVLKTLGISQLGVFPPTLIGSALASSSKVGKFPGDEYVAKYDISLTGDGRTVFMALDVLRVMEENPGKKIVVISGDVHAAGINYYLYEEEGQREFKGAIYNLLYGWTKFLPF